ncbi:hypothetical protein BDN70DRAFT_999040, partial [Pholiota conissans]
MCEDDEPSRLTVRSVGWVGDWGRTPRSEELVAGCWTNEEDISPTAFHRNHPYELRPRAIDLNVGAPTALRPSQDRNLGLRCIITNRTAYAHSNPTLLGPKKWNSEGRRQTAKVKRRWRRRWLGEGIKGVDHLPVSRRRDRIDLVSVCFTLLYSTSPHSTLTPTFHLFQHVDL